MKKTAPHDTLLFIVDMQDGMWADRGPDEFDLSQFDDKFRAFLQRDKILQEEKRHEALHDMVPAIHDYVESMRGHATPVWVRMLGDGMGGLMDGMGAQRGDPRLEKNDEQSPVPENRAAIASWQEQGYKNAIVIGAYAGYCVRSTAKDLHDMGFAVTVVADLIVDDAKPGNDEHRATALAAIKETGASVRWLADMHPAAPSSSAGKAAHLTLDL